MYVRDFSQTCLFVCFKGRSGRRQAPPLPDVRIVSVFADLSPVIRCIIICRDPLLSFLILLFCPFIYSLQLRDNRKAPNGAGNRLSQPRMSLLGKPLNLKQNRRDVRQGLLQKWTENSICPYHSLWGGLKKISSSQEPNIIWKLWIIQ